MTTKKPVNKWQFGDFQTSEGLARKVVEVLKCNHGIEPDVVLSLRVERVHFSLLHMKDLRMRIFAVMKSTRPMYPKPVHP